MSLKVEMEAEACCVCGQGSLELSSPDEYDAGAPPHQPPLRAMLLHLNNNKVVPNGRLCPICIRRTLDAYHFSMDLASKGPPPLSEKIRALRKRLHELTQKIDVFIVVGGGAGAGGEGTYSEQDIIMVERGALAAAARADAADAARAPDARGDPVYQCTLCPLAFRRMSEFRVHASSHGAGGEEGAGGAGGAGPHWCWACGAALPSAGELAEHARAHAPPHALHCTLCDTAFQSGAEMRRHEAGCPAVCPACDAELPSRAALRAHLAAAGAGAGGGGGAGGPAGAHGSVCAECFRRCASREARVAHALQHRRERHFVCGYRACILRFHTRGNLLAHIRKCHGGEEPPAPPAAPTAPAPSAARVCTVCRRTFGSAAALKRHSRVHPAPPPLADTMEVEWGEEVDKVEYLEVETLDELEQPADTDE